MSGTMRGTPNRGQSRGAIPFQTNSPGGSNIPRPVLETHASHAAAAHSQLAPSEVASGVSASRQKQSKRDEVRLTIPSAHCESDLVRV